MSTRKTKPATGRATTRNVQALAQSERVTATLEGILRAAPVGIGLVKNRVFQWTNELLSSITGYPPDELVGRSARMVYESEEEFLRVGREKYAEIDRTGIGSVETRWRRKDGSSVEILLRSAPLDPARLDTGVIFTVLDITDRKRAEAQVRASLREKEVMLREIHHRVKNNLQTISSLLDLQADSAPEDAAKVALQNSRRRVRSLALVHEILYQSDDLARFDLSAYLTSLCHHLVGMYRGLRDAVRLTVDVAGASLALDDAIPCGLIVSELVDNAYAHAFPGERSGTISVQVLTEADRVALTVADDGAGLPAEVAPETVSSLGLRLVHLLSRQLGGSLHIVRNQGTTFRVLFRPGPRRSPSPPEPTGRGSGVSVES